MKWRRLSAVVRKELRQLRRDRITLAMIVGIPVIQLVGFGYAINLTLRNLPAAVADQARTAGSREAVMDLIATNVIEPVTRADTPDELMTLLRRGKISIGIAIPPDYERRRIEGREAVQVLVDGSDTSVQAAAVQLASVPLGTTAARSGTASVPLSRRASRAELSRQPGQAPSSVPFTGGPIRIVSFYNPERRSSIYIVPALIGVILTMTMVLFTGVSVVRERERGNMELLIATPITRAELMIGKVLPYVAIGLVQVSVVLALGTLLFAVPVRGSVPDVYVAAMLLIVANLSLGLLISTRAQSQFQAMQMTFFVFLPSILLSGFMFPFAGLPRVVQYLAEIIPLTHFVRLIRGVMLRGASIWELWPDVLALVLFTLAMMSLAILRFRKRLD